MLMFKLIKYNSIGPDDMLHSKNYRMDFLTRYSFRAELDVKRRFRCLNVHQQQ